MPVSSQDLGDASCRYAPPPNLRKTIEIVPNEHPRGLSKVQSVDQRIIRRFRQLRTCRRARPGQLCAMCGRLRVGKDFLHVAGLVGAAMCSACRCGSHDRWP